MPRGSRDLLRFIGQSAIAMSLATIPGQLVIAQESPAKTESAGRTLSLNECLAMAMDQQASVRAARATLHANIAKSDALERSGRLGAVLSSDLRVRRQQVSHGIQASRLGVANNTALQSMQCD